MFDMCPNIVNLIEIRGNWVVLMAPHSKRLADRNAHLLIRSIIFYDNWLLHILFTKFLKWSFQGLVLINGEVDLFSICQFKKLEQ